MDENKPTESAPVEPVQPTPEPVSTDAAREAILKDKSEREIKCLQRINEVLIEYRCEMEPKIEITPNKNNFILSVIAKE